MKYKWNRSSFVPAIVCIALVLGACSAELCKIRVGYDSRRYRAPSVPNAKGVTLYVAGFSDERGDLGERMVGEAKTGWSNKSTPIVVEAPVDSLVTRAFRKAFEKVGFSVVNQEYSADLTFKGRINSFWVQEFTTGVAPEHTEADAEFDVALFEKASEKPIWYDVKWSHVKSQSTTINITPENWKKLHQALNEVIKAVLKDPEFNAALGEAGEADR